MIAVLTPSRGLIFAETIDAITRGLGPEDHLSVTSGMETPKAFNYLVEENTCTDVSGHTTDMLFVEEDNVPPQAFISQMDNLLKDDVGAVCIDYPLANGNSTTVRLRETNELLYCGLGCTLISHEVFKAMPKPWFRSDRAFRIDLKEWINVDPMKQYGLYDVYFFCLMRKIGFKLIQAPGVCKHLKVDSSGKSEINGGVHKISPKSETITQSYLDIDPKNYI